MNVAVQRLLKRARATGGMTLLEITMSMSMFAIIMSATAQVLVGFSGAMEVQEQRQEAMQHCRAVLAQIRQDRDTSVLPWPNQVLAVWPDNTQVQDPALVTLDNEIITVDYENAAADPLRVTIRANWTDMRGRPATTQISTLLTGTNR